jgi:uncharacterized membrane protein
MLTFKLLHILSMVAMVTTQIGGEFLYAFAISRRDVPALAAVHRLAEQSRIGILSIVFLIAGVVFGLLTAATGGFDFIDGWLIAAYVLVAVFVVLAGRQAGRIVKLGNQAVESQNGERLVDDVVRDMVTSRALMWFVADLVLVVAIIADMVLKPF